MKLVLFRHGLAVDRDDFSSTQMDDYLRPLVPKGKERTKAAGKKLKNWIEGIDLIISSPLVRAQQTAEILHGIFNKAQIDEASELVPSSPPMAFAQWLKVNGRHSTQIIAVGHEPQLSTFASWCVAGSSQTFIDLKKSGMICLEIESFEDIGPKSALLKWCVNPKMLEP